MERYADHMSLLGRMLLATIFLMSGIGKMMDPQGTQQYMMAHGMTMGTSFFYIAAVVLEIGGGLSLLLGYMTRIGATMLFLFMIPTTLIFHTQFADPNQMVHFLKNLAMCGGLLYVATYGPGRFSMDARVVLVIEDEAMMMRASDERRQLGATGS